MQKLAEYCDRRSELENTVNRLQRMYWVQSEYYNKLWRVAILRCFWREAHEYEGTDDQTHFAEAGWGESYTVIEAIAQSSLQTQEDAVLEMMESLGL